MGGLDNLIGKKFNRLLVIERAKNLNKNRNARWKCLCDCGNVVIVFGRNLKNNNTMSCGCYCKENVSKRFKKPDGFSAFHKLFDTYQRNSIKRGFKFEINEDDFREIINKNCYYCGQEPSAIQKNRNDRYIYNGIDRVDSSLGYSKGNIVPCCKICNNAKRILEKKKFINWINKAYTNLKNIGEII
jgi:hypothetical protein